MQTLIAYLIVTIAMLYALWLFMPQAGRRWLMSFLVHFAPSSQAARLARLHAKIGSVGCSTCKGCETDTPAAVPQVKTIHLHRR
jgi:hypothetical protein